jgi:hypothetical protein
MTIADDGNGMSKAARKARLEAEISKLIEQLEKSPLPATQWQKAKILDAIDATTRGLFEVASTHLAQVFAEDPERPWPHPDTNLADLDKITLDALRGELDLLRARPVQDPPDYL